MKYYKLEENLKELGHYPQTESPVQAHFDSKFNTRFATYDPIFKPDIAQVKLGHKARVTDFLFILHLNRYHFLSVNKKVYEVLSQQKIPLHECYEIPLLTSKGALNYELMHLQLDIHNYVDFSESTFELINKFTREKQDIQFSGRKYQKDMSKIDNNGECIFKPKKIKFKQGFDFDLFTSNTIRLPLTFSENLIKKIAENSLTGARFNLDEPIGFR